MAGPVYKIQRVADVIALSMVSFSGNVTGGNSSFNSTLSTRFSAATGCGTSDADPQTLVLLRFVIYEVLVPILVPFGVLANSLNVIVLTRKWMRSSTNCYLTTLAIYDSLYLLFAFFMAFSAYPSIRFEYWYIQLRQFVQPMTNVFSNTAVWIVVTFSCERYVAISYPMKGRRWCTIKKAKRIVLCVCVVCFLLTAPEFFSTRVLRRECMNVTTYRLVQNEFHTALDKYGYYHLNSTLFAYLPLFLLTVCNVLLIRAILRSRRLRKAMMAGEPKTETRSARNGNANHHKSCSSVNTQDVDRQNLTALGDGDGGGESGDAHDAATSTASAAGAGAGAMATGERRGSNSPMRKPGFLSANHKKEKGIREQNRLTLMLVIVVVAFLCCHLPSAIGISIRSYIRYKEHLRALLDDALKIYGGISNLLVQLNTASNFILYSMLSTKFRMTFRKIFCKCILSEQDSKILGDRRSASVFTNRTTYELQSSCIVSEKRNLRPPSPYEVAKDQQQ